MHRLIYLVILLSIIQCGLCLETDHFDQDYQFETETISSLSLTTEGIIEPIVEDTVDNVTEAVSTTTTVFVKPFLTEVNLSFVKTVT